jgi:hypothetical protein
VATFEAMTAGRYQVSVTRATEAGATLAAGDNFASDIATATVGAAILGLVTLLAAALLATATYGQGPAPLGDHAGKAASSPRQRRRRLPSQGTN